MRNPESFTTTEMELILTITDFNTAIRETETGQMPMEILIVPGMTKTTIWGTKLGQHELQGAGGSVDVKETTNGDYYYCDANGVGYTDNGDGTWTDENGNSYTE